MSLLQDIINFASELADASASAFDLWTWLPSHRAAVRYHGDHAADFSPSPGDVMREAATYIAHKLAPTPEHVMEAGELYECPYWHVKMDTDRMGSVPSRAPADAYEGTGECRRHAPVAVHHEPHGGPLFVKSGEHSLVWPRTDFSDWCGDHPNFPAFLASRYMASIPINQAYIEEEQVPQ